MSARPKQQSNNDYLQVMGTHNEHATCVVLHSAALSRSIQCAAERTRITVQWEILEKLYNAKFQGVLCFFQAVTPSGLTGRY
jgi:hypothetical protein